MWCPEQTFTKFQHTIGCQFCGKTIENPASNLCINCFNFNPSPPNSPLDDPRYCSTTSSLNTNAIKTQPICISYQPVANDVTPLPVTTTCNLYSKKEKISEDKLLANILDDVCEMWNEMGLPDDVMDHVFGLEYRNKKHDKELAVEAIKRHLVFSTPFQSKFISIEYYNDDTKQWRRFNAPLSSKPLTIKPTVPYYLRPPPPYRRRNSVLYDLLSSPVTRE